MIQAFISISIKSKEYADDAVKLIKEMTDIKGLTIDEQDLSDPHYLMYWVTLDGDDDTVYNATYSLRDIAKRYRCEDVRYEGGIIKEVDTLLDIYAEACPSNSSEAYHSKMYGTPTTSDKEYARLIEKYEGKKSGYLLI